MAELCSDRSCRGAIMIFHIRDGHCNDYGNDEAFWHNESVQKTSNPSFMVTVSFREEHNIGPATEVCWPNTIITTILINIILIVIVLWSLQSTAPYLFFLSGSCTCPRTTGEGHYDKVGYNRINTEFSCLKNTLVIRNILVHWKSINI